MILTENQSLQLATILMEAAADKGDKQGFLQRAKEFFKKLIEAIKEKISKFAAFVRDKVRSLLDKLHVLKLKLKGKSSEEISASLEQRETDRYIKAYYKEKLANLRTNAAYITKNSETVKQMVKEASRMATDSKVSDEEYDSYAYKLDEQLDKFKSNLLGIGLNSNSLTKKSTKYSILAYKDAVRVISEVEGVIKDSIAVNKAYSEMLTRVKDDYEFNYKLLRGDYTGNKSITLFGKVNSLVNSIGSAITNLWSTIFQVVAKVFGSFRKKKEED